MLKIRFCRIGSKNKPFFLIIIIDSRKKQNGKFIEKIGFYDPINKNKKINIKKLNYWLKNGAKLNNSIKKVIKINEPVKFS